MRMEGKEFNKEHRFCVASLVLSMCLLGTGAVLVWVAYDLEFMAGGRETHVQSRMPDWALETGGGKVALQEARLSDGIAEVFREGVDVVFVLLVGFLIVSFSQAAGLIYLLRARQPHNQRMQQTADSRR